jgi:hypothetical protein
VFGPYYALQYLMVRPLNIHFTNLIKAGGRLREFNFRKSQGNHGSMFTIDVANEKGDRFYVFFRLKDNRWVLENTALVPWIEEILPQIEKAIEMYK